MTNGPNCGLHVQFPPKLATNDTIRVLALSRSLGGVAKLMGMTEDDVRFAVSQIESLGLRVDFGRWVWEHDSLLTASREQRLEDLHEAITDPSVKAILAVSGGAGAIQLLDGIDYDLVRAHPKIICGYSDIANVCNAIYSRAGVATYCGPNFTSFMMQKGLDYTLRSFRECLFHDDPLHLEPAETWSDDAWFKDQDHREFLPNDGFWPIQDGRAEGRVVGGTHQCISLLQGSRYFPPLREAILFLEGQAQEVVTLWDLDWALRALSYQTQFDGVCGLVLGRFARRGEVTREGIAELVKSIPALNHLPVIANCDFGHTTPTATLPIGGKCSLDVHEGRASITIFEH